MEAETEEWIQINLNDEVHVKVTEKGRAIYNEFYRALRMEPPNLGVDSSGFTTMQLHEVAHIFGPAMYNGGRVPVETMIYVRRGA